LISSTYPNTTQKAHPAVCCIQKLHQLATFFSLFYKNSSEGRHDIKNETPKIFSFLMMTVRKFKKKKRANEVRSYTASIYALRAVHFF